MNIEIKKEQLKYGYCEDCNCAPVIDEEEKNLYNEIICNCCGKVIITKGQLPKKEYIRIKKTWGYFSNKDGQVHTMNICEDCYDKWVATFVKKIDKKEATELV